MCRITSIIFGYFYCLTSLTAASEEFYILPMGQGNGQLVIYNTGQPGHIAGVLYDLGSKSLQVHPKFMRRGDWDLKFIPRNVISLGESPYKTNLIDDGPSPDRASTAVIKVTTPDTTERKVGESQRKVLKEDLQEFIKRLLSGLNHLILFLSHTDVDHINYISAEVFPANLSVTAFLCGDWFGYSRDYSADEKALNTVKNVLSFLAQRKDTHLEFPYYWNNKVYLDSAHKNTDFNQYVRDQLQTLKTRDINTVFTSLSTEASCRNFHAPIPSFYSGALESVLPEPLLNTLKSNDDTMMAIRNTYVWSLNFPVGDVNDFSPIISCKLPSLNLSVVFTGDAGLPVFQSVSCQQTAHSKNSFRETLSDQIDGQHLVLMMLPHHGSLLNISGEMLRFFRPSVFGISAGDGGQHGHPSFKTIEWIQGIARQESLHKTFNSRFKKEKDLHIIAIRDQEDAEEKHPHRVVKMREDFPVFLCPNIYGCIKWDRDGIHTNFDNTLGIDGNNYYVAYASHELETTEKLNTTSDGDIVQTCIIQGDPVQRISLTYKRALTDEYLPYVHLFQDISNDIQYVGVPVEDKTYIYRLIPDEVNQAAVDRKRARPIDEGSDLDS